MIIVNETKEHEVEEPTTPCDATLQANLSRYAARNSSAALHNVLRQSEVAGYANFDPVITPGGERL